MIEIIYGKTFNEACIHAFDYSQLFICFVHRRYLTQKIMPNLISLWCLIQLLRF